MVPHKHIIHWFLVYFKKHSTNHTPESKKGSIRKGDRSLHHTALAL